MSAEINRERLRELCGKGLSRKRFILASNRGPVEYQLAPDGQLQAHRGSGGVVTALSNLSDYVEVNWIASAMGEGDREAARRANGERFKVNQDNQQLYLHFVVNPRTAYHKYYSIICNPLLWFLQHYMWNSSRTPNIDRVVYDAWENGYVPVNKGFAQAVVEDVNKGEAVPIVILHDYHLYLTAAHIREQMPELIIHHFTHIPWPSVYYWQLLPRFMREAIHYSMCNADIVGLQTTRDVNNFLYCCESFVSGAEIDYRQRTVRLNGRIVRVKAYPISIDVAGLDKLVYSAECQEYEKKLYPLWGEKTIVRVDRCEPSKNVIRGFRAFDIMLERYPQLKGKVKFIAFLVPSRTHLKPYQRYAEEVTQLIEGINNKYKTEEWHPIDYFYENNYVQAIAGMRMYDVLLVNSVVDGMNLVAKEGPIVNNRDGMLVLSEGVGACEQLGQIALTVAPTDLEGTAQALYQALTMPSDERKRHAAGLKRSIEQEDITDWLLHMIEDMINLIEERFEIANQEDAPRHLFPSR